MERIIIFIDNSNIFKGFQKYRIKVDYEKLKNILSQNRKLKLKIEIEIEKNSLTAKLLLNEDLKFYAPEKILINFFFHIYEKNLAFIREKNYGNFLNRIKKKHFKTE